MDDTEIKLRIIEKMARKEFVGNSAVDRDDATNWLPSHDQGRARELIDEMTADRGVPVVATVGGHLTLTSMADAVDWIRDNDGDVPWNAT
jgi:hypothetical protein